MTDKLQTYWQNFLTETKRSKDTNYIEAFYFGHTEELAARLLELVLQGKKTATTSCIKQYELTNSEYPKVGDLSIVTDFDGNPKCIIETSVVTRLKFNEVTYEICQREGEDETLASWQQGHQTFFSAIGEELGFVFSEEMDVLFEDFAVVYR